MANISQQNYEDICFICERVLWFLKQSPKELMSYFENHRLDALHYIPRKNGGMHICGREASKRFRKIAERYLQTRQEQRNKTDIEDFVSKLKEEFSRRFFETGEEISERNTGRMIATAYKEVSRGYKELTHYIPCMVFSCTSKSFEIGPVRFIHKSTFDKEMGEEINQLSEELTLRHREYCSQSISKGFPEEKVASFDQSKQFANSMVNSLVSAFNNFEWVAEVSIGECNSSMSYRRAVSATKAALNIIKLILGERYTYRLRTASDFGGLHSSATLTRQDCGQLNISISNAAKGNVVGDEWLEILHNKASHDFSLAAKTIELLLEFNDPPPLCGRFVDALSWYGDAVSESSHAAKIVKYVSAMERMTGTGIEKDSVGRERSVTEIVTNRSSELYSFSTGESFAETLTKVTEVYRCRSQLVHGTLSPYDNSCIEFACRAAEISRITLLSGLDYFSSLGIDDRSMSLRRLKRHYQQLENRRKE